MGHGLGRDLREQSKLEETIPTIRSSLKVEPRTSTGPPSDQNCEINGQDDCKILKDRLPLSPVHSPLGSALVSRVHIRSFRSSTVMVSLRKKPSILLRQSWFETTVRSTSCNTAGKMMSSSSLLPHPIVLTISWAAGISVSWFKRVMIGCVDCPPNFNKPTS